MVVLQHDHSLSLIDLNPKYPYDETIYDDEEDLIVKQAFQSSCDLCNQKITYYHKCYYKCNQCDYSLHKLCGEVPIELQHASHSAHTLTLFLEKPQGHCHICRSTFQHSQLQYHCSICMFNICLGCVMGDVQYHIIYHPSHQHPLIPACKQRQTLAECDACGEEHKGVFYECFTCFSFLMHSECAFKPKRLFIQDVTSGFFFHTHPLILAYSFPRVYQKAKFDPKCRLCDNSFSHSENLWVYMCEKCRYYVHLKCTNLRYESSGSGAAGTSNHNQDDPSVFHLPFPDQTQNKLIELFSRETNAESITHKSHEHPLILVDTMISKAKEFCNGCLRPIMDMHFYKCNTYGCDFVLHELCTRLPSTLDKTCPAKHGLHLNQEAIRPNAFCRLCNHYCKGFFYSCLSCPIPYTMDVSCALIVRTITHKSHPHHLLTRAEKRLYKDYCRMCLTNFNSKGDTSFSCHICNFHLHRECAFSFPETIRHKYDKHPMTLSCSPIENHEGDYFCEVCEVELNPYISFYHCHICVQSIHSTCARLKALPKLLKLYGLSEKAISKKNTHKNKFHRHPLSFEKETRSDRGCSRCHLSLTGDFIFKCLQCEYVMHAYHLNEEDDLRYKVINWNEYPYHEIHLGMSLKRTRKDGRCPECIHDIKGGDYIFQCCTCDYAIHAYHVHNPRRPL